MKVEILYNLAIYWSRNFSHFFFTSFLKNSKYGELGSIFLNKNTLYMCQNNIFNVEKMLNFAPPKKPLKWMFFIITNLKRKLNLEGQKSLLFF
jgi:hypothetical protein